MQTVFVLAVSVLLFLIQKIVFRYMVFLLFWWHRQIIAKNNYYKRYELRVFTVSFIFYKRVFIKSLLREKNRGHDESPKMWSVPNCQRLSYYPPLLQKRYFTVPFFIELIILIYIYIYILALYYIIYGPIHHTESQ